MTRFLIGQVCDALDVKPHVLRYWERHVELLSPAKDRAGRRVYTLRDVQLLFRLKYLVQTRKMSVEGASTKLVEEVQGGGQNRKAAIDALRGDLLRASLGSRRLRRRVESAARNAPGEGVFGKNLSAEAADARTRLVSFLSQRLQEGRGETAQAAGLPGRRFDRSDVGEDALDVARRTLANAPLHVVTPAPAGVRTAETYPGLLPLLGRGSETIVDRIGEALAAFAADDRPPPQWTIGVPAPLLGAVRSHLAHRRYWGLSPSRVQVIEEPEIPFLSGDGTPIPENAKAAAGGEGDLAPYRLPLLTALFALSSASREDGAEVGLVLPVTNALPRVPDIEFLAHHINAGSDLSVKVARPAVEATGELLLSLGPLESLLSALSPPWKSRRVMRSAEKDDILEETVFRAELSPENVAAAAARPVAFEVAQEDEILWLRSPSEWESCSEELNRRA
jgi:DNA-binding transcriptional MerR regulator